MQIDTQDMLQGDASSTGMLFLNKHEQVLVQKVFDLLDVNSPGDAAVARQSFDCLKSLGKTIALYPPMKESQILKGYTRDKDQLVKALSGLAPSSHLLRIPARIQAVRSFLVTKFNCFSLLCKVLDASSEYYKAVRSALLSAMFTIMAEDVCFSCLDDPFCPTEIKNRMAYELISLWDFGAEPEIIMHFQALEALWTARNNSPPCYGTLEGASELIRLSIDLEEDWHDFLRTQVNTNEETHWALEEFLFGLSYEELLSLRLKIKQSGLTAVDSSQIRSYLNSPFVYTVIDNSDPRLIHDFYIDRKDMALLRKRSNNPGPTRTLEEIYLIYRMQ